MVRPFRHASVPFKRLGKQAAVRQLLWHGHFSRATLCTARLMLSSRVCLSVTRRCCIETDEDIIKLFIGLILPPLWFSNTTYVSEILKGKGACHWGGVRYFRSKNA